MPTLNELRPEYERLFTSCTVNNNKFAEIDNIANKIIGFKPRYDAIGNPMNIPWYFIGILHMMEGGLNFNKHLHNGDPLTARTVQVPKGRPKTGTPPFTFEASCADALQMDGYDTWTDWSIPGQLYLFEKYNGFGYRRSNINIPTPYLWSYSNHYTKGKYASDGKYDPSLVSKQPGTASILRRLAEKQVIDFTDQRLNKIKLIKQLGELVVFAPSEVNEEARRLQVLLNEIGFPLLRDGKAGQNTSNAYKQASGKYLKADPRRTA
jgi:lysozyme family protein